MPTIRECIDAAIATGRLAQEDADAVLADVERYTQELIDNHGYNPADASRVATEATLAGKQAQLRLKKYQKALQVIALSKNLTNIRNHEEGFLTGLFSLLVPDLTRKATYRNVDRTAQGIIKEMHRRFAEPMEALRTKFLGLKQDRETMKQVVRELLGEDTKNAMAKTFANAFSEVAEYARVRFNKAGGAIPKRQDWGLPQWHDPAKVGRMDPETWAQELIPFLDRDRMLNADGLRMSDTELHDALLKAHERIRTNGLVDALPGQVGPGKLANRRQDSRFLVFKDADSWLEYSEKYGRPDLYSTLTDHIEGMANDIALLETMGPNPEHTYRVLRDLARKEDEAAAGLKLSTLDSVWNTVSGKTADTASLKWADFGSAVRNWLTAARLGSAMLSAVSDIAFLTQTARWTGMSGTKVMGQVIKNLNPLNKADRLFAVKLGLGAEAWATRALAANRFTEVTGAGLSAKAADFTMRASGLSAWTDAAKKAFGMEFMGVLGDNLGRNFDELPKDFRTELERFGFTDEDWNVLRATDPMDHKGAKYFSIENLMARDDLPERTRTDLGTRIESMISELTLFAVPEPDARARAFTTGGFAKGTRLGESWRFVGQFKSFPISVILRHVYRGMYEKGMTNKLSYLGSMVVATTVLGGLALQAKEISKGREPRNMDDPKFWGAAFMQGGGAGIYGDFIYAGVMGTNRFGGNMLTSLAGPAAGLMFSDLPKATLGQLGDVALDRDPKVAVDMIRFAKNYMPGGSLWYARLALEREVFDQLELMADPKARQKFRRKQRRYMKDYGQEYWWRPGEQRLFK